MVVEDPSRIPEKNLSDHHYKTSRAGFPIGPRVGAHGRDKDPGELALAIFLPVTNTVTSFVTKLLEVLYEARYAWPATMHLTVLGQPGKLWQVLVVMHE